MTNAFKQNVYLNKKKRYIKYRIVGCKEYNYNCARCCVWSMLYKYKMGKGALSQVMSTTGLKVSLRKDGQQWHATFT